MPVPGIPESQVSQAVAGLYRLRARFKSVSGRTDLSNSRIDYFLNEGIKLLDRLSNYEKGPARQFIKLAAASKTVEFSSDCMLIKAVWIIDKTDGSRTRLDKAPELWIRENMGTTGAKPTHWCPRTIRPYPENLDKDSTEYTDYKDYMDIVKTPDYQAQRG